MLEQAQNRLEEFTQLCTAGDEGFSEDPLGEPEKVDSVNGDLNGVTQTEREGERVTPSSLPLSQNSDEMLQEKLTLDPDDITPEVELHDNHVTCVPPPPSNGDIIEDEDGDRFEDAVSNFTEPHDISNSNKLPQTTLPPSASDSTRPPSSTPPNSLSSTQTSSSTAITKAPRTVSPRASISSNPQPVISSHRSKITVPTSPMIPERSRTYFPASPTSQSPAGCVVAETTDGGKVGMLFGGMTCVGGGGGGGGKGKERRREREESGEEVFEKSMIEFDSFLEGVPDEDLAKVCI